MAQRHLRGGTCRSTITTTLLALCLMLVAASSAQAGPTLRGVQVHSLWGDVSDANMDRELDLARGANANVIRVDVGWASLEDEAKGRWNSWYLPRLDRLVNGASARGMQVIATVWGTPCWASSAPASVKQGCANPNWWGEGVQYPPTKASDFGDVTRFLTARYGTKLAGLEVWNEPNEGKRFLNAPDQAAAYATILKAGYAGAKSGNADVPVIAGALAKSDGNFLSRLFAAGIKGSYDGLSIHPYNEWRAPTVDGSDTLNSFASGIASVHAAQLAAGDNTPLWITEFGWTTATGTNWHVDATQQADYTGQAFGVLASLDYVKAATVYELRDRSNDPADFESNFGMVTSDYGRKPAYEALKTALTLPTTAPAPLAAAATPVTAAPSVATTATAGSPTTTTGTAGSQTTTTQTAGSQTATPKPVVRRSTAKRIQLTVAARRGAMLVEAVGMAPRDAAVRLTVEACGGRATRKLRVTANAAGHFRRPVGRASAMRDCRIVAAARNLRASTRVV